MDVTPGYPMTPPDTGKKRIIIIAGILGIILLVIIVLITLLQKKSKGSVSESSSSSSINRSNIEKFDLGLSNSTYKPSQRRQKAIESIKTEITRKPVETKDFILQINSETKDIELVKKTANADQALTEWLQTNKIPDVLHEKKLTKTEITSKVLAWLDKTRVYGEKLASPSKIGEYICNGGYASGQYCEDNLVCNKLVAGNDVGLYAVWARFKAYEATKDPTALAILQKDLATYADSKSISTIQPQLWSVRLMYEISKSPLVDYEQKKNIEQIYYRIQHNPEVINPVEYTVKKKGSIPEISIADFQRGTYNENDGVVYTNRLNSYAAYSSEYLYTHLVLKEMGRSEADQYLSTARGLFNNAVRSYVKYGITKDDDVSVLGVASLDMYSFSRNKQYLDFANYLYDKHISQTACDKMLPCANMVYFVDYLTQFSPDQKKSDKINSIIEAAYNQKFDDEGTAGYQMGVGAFYDFEGGLKKNTAYDILPNALFAAVLSKLKQ